MKLNTTSLNLGLFIVAIILVAALVIGLFVVDPCQIRCTSENKKHKFGKWELVKSTHWSNFTHQRRKCDICGWSYIKN